MKRALLLGFGLSLMIKTSCVGPRLPEEACRDACEVAARCGILPSTLGGAAGDDEAQLAADCERRCLATDADAGGYGDGEMYVAEDRACVHRIDPDGTMTVFAGQCGERGYAGDGGPPADALLADPIDVEVDAAGNVYILDEGAAAIRVVYR